MLKGRQTGGMHRGHAWVFRAESHDTMMAWFTDIKELTEKSGKERDAFVRRTHARSISGGSLKANSIGGSSDGGLEEDEADAQPYSSEQSVRGISSRQRVSMRGVDHQHDVNAQSGQGTYSYVDERLDASEWRPSDRPSPGGRFPSDLNVHRGLQAPLSPSSGESSTERDRDIIAAAGSLPGSNMPFPPSQVRQHDYQDEPVTGRRHPKPHQDPGATPLQQSQQPQYGEPQQSYTPAQKQYTQPQHSYGQTPSRSTEDQGNYAAPVAAAGVAAAVYTPNELPKPQQQHRPENVTQEMDQASAIPAAGTSSPPIMTDPAAPITTTSQTGTATTLSTIPTSIDNAIDSSSQPQTATAITSTADAPSSSTTTPPARRDEAGDLPSKPAPIRSMTAGTISDLHVPGEYPRTPKQVL
jgi:hypothetical protein